VSGHDTAEASVETPLHRAPAETKVLATVLFVIAVALIPRGHLVWPYAVDAALLGLVAIAARTPAGLLAGRLAIEAPFVLFVVLLPFVVHDGGWLAFGIAAKATLAVLATGVLAWTTPAPEILRGAERLGAPRLLTAIAGFALRYLRVLMEEFRRMRLARALRSGDAHWRPQPRVLGALALRSFERGERVHAAMLARGYDGRMPDVWLVPRARVADWTLLAFPAAAFAVLGVAL
jgi:cobalt/nickel transport system permease protein